MRVVGSMTTERPYFQWQSQAPPGAQSMQLLWGYRISQATSVAVRLGIVDLLADGARSSDELAQAVGAHPRALYRLLRALASVGIFTEVEPKRFGLTPMGDLLRTDAPTSLRGHALLACREPV
jgi:hypothetical protein